MNVSEFSEEIAKSGVVILDIRTPAEIAEGFIAGAQKIDFYSDNFESEVTSLDKDATYAIYCRSGKRSGQALKMMQDAGFHNLFHLDGGILDWNQQGMPLVSN